MNKRTIKQELDNLPDIDSEEEDIVCAMRDEAEFSRNWINDCILRQHSKKIGDNRLNARTRKLIKVKSYMTYIGLSKKLQNNLKRKEKALLSEIQES